MLPLPPSNRIRKAKTDLNAPLKFNKRRCTRRSRDPCIKSLLKPHFSKGGLKYSNPVDTCPQRSNKPILFWLLPCFLNYIPPQTVSNPIKIQSILSEVFIPQHNYMYFKTDTQLGVGNVCCHLGIFCPNTEAFFSVCTRVWFCIMEVMNTVMNRSLLIYTENLLVGCTALLAWSFW